jgi:hypothetical protein
MIQSKVKTLLNNQISNFMNQSGGGNQRKSERFHEQSIELLNKFYENKIIPNKILKEVKQEIIDFNIRPEILRFAINITKKFFVSKNDVENKFYLKQLNTFNQYQYAFIGALNINYNINYFIQNDYNNINIKHISKKLFNKKNAEKLAINIIRTILITITQLCLLTHSELYELNIENSNANKLITNLIYFLLNSNILVNENYYKITNVRGNELANNMTSSGNTNTSANVGHSSPAAMKAGYLFKSTNKSKLIIESIIKPAFELILNLSDYYYDLMIKCSKYLKEFNYLLNKYKTNNSNFYSNLTYILQITSLAYNRILDDKQVNACFERAKEIYHKSKIREINEKYRLKLDVAKHRIERCREEFEGVLRAQQRSKTAEKEFLNTNQTEYIGSPKLNASRNYYFKSPSISVTNETTRLDKCKENFDKAELYYMKLQAQRDNSKNKFKINRSNINEKSYKEKIIPFLNGYHGTTLLTWDFVHSFIFNSYQTICIHLVNIIYKLIIKKFFTMNYKFKLANLWKLLTNSFIIRIHAVKLAKSNQTIVHDHFYTTQFQLLYQHHQQQQQQASSLVNTIYSDYDEINLNVELLNEIELYKKFNRINYYDKCLISNCIDYFIKMRENNECFYI